MGNKLAAKMIMYSIKVPCVNFDRVSRCLKLPQKIKLLEYLQYVL